MKNFTLSDYAGLKIEINIVSDIISNINYRIEELSSLVKACEEGYENSFIDEYNDLANLDKELKKFEEIKYNLESLSEYILTFHMDEAYLSEKYIECGDPMALIADTEACKHSIGYFLPIVEQNRKFYINN